MAQKDEEGPVDIPKGKILGKRWRIKEKLGEGGCGAVYKVIDIRTGGSAALKAENNNVAGGAVLKLEVQILKKLKGRKHVAQLYHSGKRNKYSYMVMTLLGDSLERIMDRRSTFSVSTQTRVGIHILYAIKQLHEVGYIHRDVKPANLALGRRGNASRIIHLLDFGLAREFVMKENGKVIMRRARTDTLFRGTTRYCSASTHTRLEQGRPDDLWSMVYVLVEMRTPLPWERITDKKEIGKMKETVTDRQLCLDCPVQMLDITAHLRSLNYYTRPDYLLIYKKFDEILKQGNFKLSDPYDWEKPSAAMTLTRKLKKTLTISEEQPDISDRLLADMERSCSMMTSEEISIDTKKSRNIASAPAKSVGNQNGMFSTAKESAVFTEADFGKNELGF